MKITWIGSPNFDTSRKSIKQIVIHWIVGNLTSADAQFQKKDPGVSAHYAVEDETIHQYVKEEHTAYAVGVYKRNQETISIEHSASSDRPASDKTYETSGKLIADICQRNNIPLDREHIIAHREIKATQCPGTVDIDRLISIAKSQSEPMATITQKELDEMRFRRDAVYDILVEIAVKLNIDNPNDASADRYIKAIEGIRSATTACQNKLNETEEQLRVANQEIRNRVEQLARVRDECQEEGKLQIAQIDSLSKQLKIAQEPNGELLGRIRALQEQVDKLAKEKGNLLKEMAKTNRENFIIRIVKLIVNRFVKR